MKTLELEHRKVALPKRQLPASLVRAAGLLKRKLKKTGLQYQRATRKEW